MQKQLLCTICLLLVSALTFSQAKTKTPIKHLCGLEEGGSIVGKDFVDITVEVGVEGRISIMSGKGSVSGTGKIRRNQNA